MNELDTIFPMRVKTQFFQCCDSPNHLQLESGRVLGPITIAYETYGQLNKKRSNVVLVCHALSGDAHAAFEHEDDGSYIGWWDLYIGPEKAIDTNKYFVISTNVIGGCKGSTGPNSINPETGEPYGLSFPIITIGDMVNAQKKLMDYLGMDTIEMVIGGSMGGMQALEWSIMYPDRIRKCVPIAATSSLSPQALSFDAVGRHAIVSDNGWNKGGYYNQLLQPEKGLAIARMIGHITYLTDQSMDIKFGRKLQEKEEYGYKFTTDFQVESYLKYQGDKFVNRFDANSYLYLTKALSYFDLSKKYGSLHDAFTHVSAAYLLIAIQSDWLYPPKQSKQICQSLMMLNKNVNYYEVQSPYGHDAFLLQNDPLQQIISTFLSKS